MKENNAGNHTPHHNHHTFNTKLGVIAATVGSAVGLGNIWRFPYEAGVHGGGAFMLIYILFILVMGIPVICAEFIIGRHTHRNVNGAFGVLSRNKFWSVVGVIGITASLMILGFYSVVAGWTMEYVVQSVAGFGGSRSVDTLHEQFDSFSASGWRPVMWVIVFLLINYAVLRRGVEKGIEKMANIMMPALFLILLAFCVNSLTMDGAADGLKFLFSPDFSKVDTSVLLGAMGQAFFSLSLGLGCLITYSSYFNNSTPLFKSACITAGLDTLTAILAGVMIFPAVFTFGAEPAAGPRLVFEVLPSIFADMPGGSVWSTLFFLLLFIASLTSTISMSEISIAYLCQERNMSRGRATIICTAVSVVLGVLCALSFGPLSEFTVFDLTFFNLLDFGSSNVLLPVGGVVISIFVGWFLDRRIVNSELESGERVPAWIVRCVVFCLRFVAPVVIAIVFIAGLLPL